MPPVYEALLLNTVVPQIQAAQAGDSYVMVVNATTDALRITQTGTGNALVVEDSSNPDATPFVVSAAGDVGIGTNAPGAKLDVNSSAAAVMRLTRNGGTAANTALQYFNGTVSWYAGMSASGLYSIGYNDAALDSGQLRLDSSGNLGLGVTPSAWSGFRALQIGGTTSLWSSTSGNSSSFYTNNGYFNGSNRIYLTNGFASEYIQGSGQHIWYNAPSGTAGNPITFTQAMTLDASGNLLVGTTSGTGYKLRVEESGANLNAALFKNQTAGFATSEFWNAATSGDNSFIQFYTEASPTTRGNITYNRGAGLVAYNTTSDYRAKDILGPVANSGATIDALKVYTGKMKGATQSRPMLVAHEAQEVTPYAVTGEKDAVNDDGTPKYQQMDVSSLVPLLIAELQSLRARVAQLEAK